LSLWASKVLMHEKGIVELLMLNLLFILVWDIALGFLFKDSFILKDVKLAPKLLTPF